MKFATVLKLIRFWPPFLGAGIKVKNFSADCSSIRVQMNLHFWNKNYVGTHFGGSLYSMTDPFYMLMLMSLLGKDYIVWDKSASIRYKKPARGTVYAQFDISPEQIQAIKSELQHAQKMEVEFSVPITNEEGEVVSEIKKILHINKRTPPIKT